MNYWNLTCLFLEKGHERSKPWDDKNILIGTSVKADSSYAYLKKNEKSSTKFKPSSFTFIIFVYKTGILLMSIGIKRWFNVSVKSNNLLLSIRHFIEHSYYYM